MPDNIEQRSASLDEIKAGLKLRAGHRVVIVVSGVKGDKRYAAGGWDEDSDEADESEGTAGASAVTARGADGESAPGANDSAAGAGTKGGAQSGAEGQGAAPSPADFKHVLALTLVAIGGTPLANERVQVIDPDSGETVGDPIETNAQGEMRAMVPEKKEYHVQVLDDAPPADTETPRPMVSPDLPMHIDALFLDSKGAPVANEQVAVTTGGAKTEGTTDAEGWFHLATDSGLSVLEVRGQKFRTHAAASGIANGGYRFVIGAEA
jgi:hypothetical protein